MKKKRRHKLQRLALVLAEIFARFFGLGAVADGDSSRRLFVRLFFSASNRCVSAIVFSTVTAFLTFLSQERQTSWGSVLSRGRTSPWTCCTKSKIIPYRPTKSTRRKIDSTFNRIQLFRSSHIFTCFIRFRFCLWTRFEQSHLLL